MGGYDKPMSEVKELATTIALSKIFGTLTQEAATMIALHLMIHDISPLDYKREWHVVKGNPSMRADAMLANFHKLGHKSTVLERSATKVEVELQRKEGQPRKFSLTWADAQKEPFVYEGKDDEILSAIKGNDPSKLKLKAKYQTDHARMQMLWARVVSDAVRAVAPEVNFGAYAPEEVEDFQGGDVVGVESKPAKPATAPAAEPAKTIATVAAQTKSPEASPLAVPSEGAAMPTKQRTPPKDTTPCTPELEARAKELLAIEKQRNPTCVQDFKNKCFAIAAPSKLIELYAYEVQGLIDAMEGNTFMEWLANSEVLFNRTPF